MMKRMSLNHLVANRTLFKVIALIAGIIFSITVLSPFFSDISFHEGTLGTIESNKNQAMLLSGMVTLASTALSLLPDDTASPLAEELSDLATPLLLIVCILYFEYFMLTTMETLAFGVLLPCSLGLYAAYYCMHKRSLLIIATKLLLLAVLCAVIIPAGVYVTDMIEKTFEHSVNSTFAKVDELKEAFSRSGGNEGANAIVEFFSKLKNGTAALIELAKELLTIMIDAIAILVVTSCMIPVLTLVIFVWGVKSIIAGKMENLEDTAVNVIKKIPNRYKELPDHQEAA